MITILLALAAGRAGLAQSKQTIVAGVWGWAGVVLAARAEVPEADWATFMNEVASVWVKYAYPDGSLVLPRYM